jgi:hypothetical protein
MRQLLLRVILLITSWFAVASTSISVADERAFEQFRGEYRDVSTELSKKRIETAIDEATAPMGWLARSIARRKLRAENPAYDTVLISMHGDLLTTTFAGRPFTSDTYGRVMRNVDSDGRLVGVSYSANEHTLHARYVAADGEKRFDLTLAPGNRLLNAQVTLSSNRLPRSVRYTLAYIKVL